MNVHDHHWVYVFDAIITYDKPKSQVIADGEDSRAEYCIACSTLRVRLSGGSWAYMQGDLTRTYLSKFDKETDRIVKDPPDEFRVSKLVTSTKTNQQRLGRSLGELLKQAQESRSNLPSIFSAQPRKKN